MGNLEKTGTAGDFLQMKSCALSGKELSIGYRHGSRGKTIVAENLDLSLFHGEVVCLVGPNGAGKSTLLRTLTGLQPPLSGNITIDDIDILKLDIKARARKIGVVLTERVNAGVLPAFDLVALGRHPHTDWAGRLSEKDITAINRALQSVGAGDLRNRNVNELSDGERQKVLIARALAQEPAIIVLDEPTAFLDLPRRVEILGLLKRLTRSTDRAILLSTHDLDLAIRAADRMWLMDNGGSISSGAPEDLILRGELERVFASEGVSFDREQGSFHLAAEIKGYIRLEGEGYTAEWTRRALRREGIDVSKEGPSVVLVKTSPDGVTWTFDDGCKAIQCDSIYNTIMTVRDHLSEKNAH
jgi:iron complex transport system ATP-binding protein